MVIVLRGRNRRAAAEPHRWAGWGRSRFGGGCVREFAQERFEVSVLLAVREDVDALARRMLLLQGFAFGIQGQPVTAGFGAGMVASRHFSNVQNLGHAGQHRTR
jgi:hypothetical protein